MGGLRMGVINEPAGGVLKGVLVTFMEIEMTKMTGEGIWEHMRMRARVVL